MNEFIDLSRFISRKYIYWDIIVGKSEFIELRREDDGIVKSEIVRLLPSK